MIIYLKKRILDCTLLFWKAHRNRLEHERSVGRNTSRYRRMKLQLTETHNKLKTKETNKNKNTTYVHNYSVKKERKTPKNPPKHSVLEGNDKM